MSYEPNFNSSSEVFLDIHHVGVVVNDIEEYIFSTQHSTQHLTHNSLPPWMKVEFGTVSPIHEPKLQAKVLLVGWNTVNQPKSRFEFIAPDSASSPLNRVLQKNSRPQFHHLAISVTNLDLALAACHERKMITLVPPTPSVSFGGKLVAFVMREDLLIWELVAL